MSRKLEPEETRPEKTGVRPLAPIEAENLDPAPGKRPPTHRSALAFETGGASATKALKTGQA
ncbi:MAG: hypothetical protein ACREAC_16150 [Blastocatellia bacterium]